MFVSERYLNASAPFGVVVKARRRAVPHRLSRGPQREFDILQLAWSNAGAEARQRFLSDVIVEICGAQRARAGFRGFEGPEERAYRREREWSTTFALFLKDCTVESNAHRVQASLLLRSLNKWCAAKEYAPWTGCALAAELKLRGFARAKSRCIYWLGLKLIDAHSAAPPAPPLKACNT
jgi:hypothetical protein